MSHASFQAFGTRSTFGAQPMSRRRTSPQFGFGSSTREHQDKVFISQEHAALNTAVPRSPGPATYVPRASIGPQVNAQMKSSPLWGFGNSQRFELTKSGN